MARRKNNPVIKQQMITDDGNIDEIEVVSEEENIEAAVEEPVEEPQPIFMEEEEYKEYIQNQAKEKSEEEKTPVAQVSMFQMNKDLVRGLKKMTNMEINNALEKIQDWVVEILKDKEMKHFALLNHEKHYFTIFAANAIKRPVRMGVDESFIKELKDVITNHYGDHDIRSIEVETIDGKPSGAVEIWAMWDEEPTVAYLFPYEQGVVYY